MNIKDWFWLIISVLFVWVLTIVAAVLVLVLLPLAVIVIFFMAPWLLYGCAVGDTAVLDEYYDDILGI